MNLTVLVVAGKKKALSEKRPCARVVSVTHSATLSDETAMSMVPSAFGAAAILNKSFATGTWMLSSQAACQ